MDLILSNLLNSIASTAVFIYYQVLTFLIGFVFLPYKKDFLKSHVDTLLASWLTGFGIFNFIAIILLSLGALNETSKFLCGLGMVIIICARKGSAALFWGAALKVLPKGRLDWPRNAAFMLFIVFITAMFLSCFAPPTKGDEIYYGVYYTKKLLLDGAFKQFYSPAPAFGFMAVSVYNTWFYSRLTEYAAALNSVLYYIMAVLYMYYWSKERFGKNTAVFSCLISGFALHKTITCAAPGDNTLNFLLLMAGMMAAYDLFKKCAPSKIFTLYLIFFTAIAVKFTNIILVCSMLIFIYAFNFRKILFKKEHLLPACLGFLFILPFFIKQYFLWGNPVFPMAYTVLGSGPFDIAALKEGFNFHVMKSPLNLRTDLLGLIKSPIRYIAVEQMFLNPFTAPLLILGLIRLIKEKIYSIASGMAVCYGASFFLLPHYSVRYYLGLIDFLVILGCAELLRAFPEKIRERAAGFFLSAATLCASVILLFSIRYNAQFISYFLNPDRGKFLRPRIECFETINWANKNLPKDSLLLTNTRGRYYYNMATETFDPSVFGKERSCIKDPQGFYNLLKENNVGYLMNAKHNKHTKKNDYDLFCETSGFCELIYNNPNEMTWAGRWIKPLYGKTAVYKLKSKK